MCIKYTRMKNVTDHKWNVYKCVTTMAATHTYPSTSISSILLLNIIAAIFLHKLRSRTFFGVHWYDGRLNSPSMHATRVCVCVRCVPLTDCECIHWNSHIAFLKLFSAWTLSDITKLLLVQIVRSSCVRIWLGLMLAWLSVIHLHNTHSQTPS